MPEDEALLVSTAFVRALHPLHPPLPCSRAFLLPYLHQANAGVVSWELTQRSDVKGSWKNETLLNPMLDQFPDKPFCTKGAWELMCARKVMVGEAGLVLTETAWT